MKSESEILLMRRNFSSSNFFGVSSGSINDKCLKSNMIFVSKHTRYMEYPAHSREYIELCYVFRGRSVRYIEGSKIELRSGNLIFVGPNTVHKILPLDDSDTVINFTVPRCYFNFIFEFVNNNSLFSNFLIDSIYKTAVPKAFVFDICDNYYVECLLHDIIFQSAVVSHNNLMRTKLLFGLLVIELFKETPEIIHNEYLEGSVFSQVVCYIENDLRNANLNDIAAKLDMKNYNLSKLIKKESGKTFNDLVRDIRFEKFCELVKLKSVSINELALEVGFTNTSFFYLKFKRKFGMSPSEYRDKVISKC